MKRTRRIEWIFLALALLLAAGLRLTRLDLIEFKYDEATTARSALAIARQGRFPATGMISSRGPRNPPLMSYVLALPFALSRDPRLAAGWVALLGVAAVGLTFWMGRAYFGWRVGAVAALLFAASPWAVFQSRKIWAQNLPALTLVFVAAVLSMVVRRSSWGLSAALAAAGCLTGLHLGGLAFFLILAVIAVLFRRRIRPGPLLVGLTLVALILAPYLLHDARHGWPNLHALVDLLGRDSALDLQAPRMAALVVGGRHFEDLAGARHGEFVASILDLRWLDQAEIALFWAGLAWLAWQVGREAWVRRGHLSRQGAARLVIVCWLAVPVALLLRHAAPVHPHDLSTLYPVQHLVIALLAVDVVDGASRRWRPQVARALTAGLVLLAVALVAWQVYLQQALLTFVDTHETPGGYGAPLKYALAAARRADALRSAAENATLIALLPGADPRYDGQATVFDVLLNPGSYRLVDGRAALVLPSRPTIYIADPRAQPSASAPMDVTTEVKPALPLRGGSDAEYRFSRWQPTTVRPPHLWDGEPRRWACGPTLLGYDWSGEPRPGGRVHWTLYWRVESQPPAETAIHWFNHLVDTNGVRWGQLDGVGFPPADWRVGDTVLTWFDIAVDPAAPPPPYFVRTGMYVYPEVVNIPLVDAAGNPAGEFVELGPIYAAP